ncbi:putative efflux protein, MATE family [Tessaracoccus bendigoensis DSM 12906]|uniref:Putative efflux protein, MATE family n=1 Tax=Tessaracoccus bendigoensis DSM 12906 TaxID=1123357 RepID=A0A1M6EHB0_9ACTN|nr:MATE family efflux transporter [Tessaracoccus bendigoensis]SHI84882.1 putative efflux protein, MATE family [Tessaracoccus bendigoensis DSM 12906]
MSLTRRILNLAVPAFAALLAQPLMLLADTWIVGRLGTIPLAGLSIGSGLLLTVVGLSIFLAYGSTAVVGRLMGAGQRRRGLEMGVQAMWVAAALGALLAVVMWPTAPLLASALGARGEVLGYAVDYLRWSSPGLPGMLVMLAATGTFRGLANAHTPMVLSLTSALLNFVLNIVFVFGLGMGIAGAALGTALAETTLGLSAAALVTVSARRQGARLAPSWADMRHSLKVGFPLWLRTLALRAAMLLTTYIAAAQGAQALAAHHIAMNVWNLLAYALDALAIAGQTIIATALGGGDHAEARASTSKMVRWSIGAGIVLGLVAIITRGPVAAVFSTDGEVRDIVGRLLLVVGATLGLAGYVYLLDGVLMGAGDGPYLARAGLITLAVYAPLALIALLLPSGWPALLWLWLSFTVGFMGARAVTLGWRARGDRWLSAQVS